MSVIDNYLRGVAQFLQTKNSSGLRLYLRVEPPLPEQFVQLSQELKASYRDGDVLERKITNLLPENDDENNKEGDVWPGFLAFIKEYLEYWRDVNFDDLLETYSQLSGLAK